MSSKITDLNKRIKQKTEALAKEIEARDKKIEGVKKLEQDIKLLEAELVMAYLVAHDMTPNDLADLLGSTDEEAGYVSGN